MSRSAWDDVTSWCVSASDLSVFIHGLLDRLGAVIGFDGAFLAVVDPATLLYTRAFRRGMPPEASPAFLAAEFGVDDINQLRQLVGSASPVGWLDEATGGDRMAARRYRMAMRPYGLGDELRIALVAGGECWGLLCLHRAQAVAGFATADGARLAALGPGIALALRRTLLIGEATVATTSEGPGVAVLGPDGTVTSVTEAGSRWLEELSDLDNSQRTGLPTVVASVVALLKDAPGGASMGASARVLVRSGRWLTVHASRLDGADRSVAVIVEPTAAAALAPLIVAAFGLTPRETEVTQRLLIGQARKTIASGLHLSLHTVNDHVKAVFDKTGSSSAGELRARIFRQGTLGPTP